MSDVFTPYEDGLKRLLAELGSNHPHYADTLTLQARLLENLAQARQYGDTETRRAERAQIMNVLNQLALEATKKNFNDWCRLSVDEEIIQSTPTPKEVSDSPSLPISQLPSKSYRELVGRGALVGEVMTALRDPAGKWIVAVDGMGGIGKTALAREAADRCLAKRLFDVVVWEQASKEEFIQRKDVGSFTFESALDAIARKLGALDVPQLKGAEKEARVRALLQSQRVLVVLDNLETAKEPQNEIARRLHPLLDPSKALLTSRHRFRGDLYAIPLPGLDEAGSLL